MLGTYKEAGTGTGQKEPNQRPERFGQRLGVSKCGLVRYAETLLSVFVLVLVNAFVF